jgi:hypothetical protein
MEADRFSSATTNTAKAMDKAVGKINEDNDLNKKIINLAYKIWKNKRLITNSWLWKSSTMLNHKKTYREVNMGP